MLRRADIGNKDFLLADSSSALIAPGEPDTVSQVSNSDLQARRKQVCGGASIIDNRWSSISPLIVDFSGCWN